ncbi:MAG TPA: hypothetical protein VNF29_11615 [Candidatus Binataceae bacterium]|nr:hypothetical protein [Candidatus Binataceae bacterium]
MSDAAEKVSQNVGVSWFHQMLIAARLSGQAAVLFLPVPAQRDDHQVRPVALVAHAAGQLEAVHSRQANIEKNDVRRECAQKSERNRSILGDADCVAVPREDQSQTLGDIVVIFDQKNTPTDGRAPLER